MAAVAVTVDHTANLADKISLMQHYGRNFANQVDELNDYVQNMANDPDYTMIETHFGLAAGAGLAFYNRVVAAKLAMESGQLAELLSIYVVSKA